MDAPSKVDWSDVRKAYLHSYRDSTLLSYDELAARFNLAEGKVANRAVAEGWQKDISPYVLEARAPALEQAQVAAAETQAQIRARHARLAREM